MGQNVCFTGCGGMGKALVLKRMLEFLREKHHGADDVIITAPTGIAGEVLGFGFRVEFVC